MSNSIINFTFLFKIFLVISTFFYSMIGGSTTENYYLTPVLFFFLTSFDSMNFFLFPWKKWFNKDTLNY